MSLLKSLLKSLLQYEICKAKLEEVPEDPTWTSLSWMTESFSSNNWKVWYEQARTMSQKDIVESFALALRMAKQEAIMPYVDRVDRQWLEAVVEKSAAALNPESFFPPLGSA